MVRTPRVSLLLLCTQRSLSLSSERIDLAWCPSAFSWRLTVRKRDLERGLGRLSHAVPHLLFYFADQSSGEALFVDSSSSKNLLFWLVYSPMNIWLQFRICFERAGEMRCTLLFVLHSCGRICPSAVSGSLFTGSRTAYTVLLLYHWPPSDESVV